MRPASLQPQPLFAEGTLSCGDLHGGVLGEVGRGVREGWGGVGDGVDEAGSGVGAGVAVGRGGG